MPLHDLLRHLRHLRHQGRAGPTRAVSPLLVVALAGACSPVAARSLPAPAAAAPPSSAAALAHPDVTAAPSPIRPETVSTGPIFLLGDSLTVGVEPYLASFLPGRRVRFDAQVGRTTAEGIAVVAAHPSELAPTVVVGLGTNDDPSPSEFAQNVDDLMALLAGRHVLWVNLARSGYEPLNAILVAAIERYPNLQLIDWDTPFSARPQDQAGDGIHANEAGYRLRAQIIASALESPSPSLAP